VGLELPRQLDALADHLLDVARAVLAPLGVEADNLHRIGPRPDELFRNVQELAKSAVDEDEPQVLVHHTHALVQVIESFLSNAISRHCVPASRGPIRP
jgi:uncharacterized protein YgfB (UPF0149 family)